MTFRRFGMPMVIVIGLAALTIWRVVAVNAPLEVVVGRAEVEPLVLEWSAVGYVESISASVTSPGMGRIIRVLVEEGAKVRRGQTLAILQSAIEDAGLTGAAANARVAEAQEASASSLLAEAVVGQASRERRARDEVISARMREEQALLSLARSRETARAAVAAAAAEIDAATASLRDLQEGGRPEEIARADAALREAEASSARAETDYRRALELEHAGAASKRDVDLAREADLRLKAALEAARETASLVRKGARRDQIAAAQARVRVAEAHAAAAKADARAVRMDERRRDEAASARRAAEAALQEVQAGRHRVDALRQDRDAARARVVQGRAGVAQSQAVRADRRVVAPFDGIVGRRYADPGDMASPQTPLFSIVDPDHIWVMAEVDEQDLAPVRMGGYVSVETPTYAGREFAGRIERIGQEAIPQTEVRTGARIVRVRISFDDLRAEERSMLKPGMEVHVTGSSVVRRRALLIPGDGVLTDHGRTYVWLVSGGRAHKRIVETGQESAERTEIVRGLKPGDAIILSGKDGMTDGRPVRTRRERR